MAIEITETCYAIGKRMVDTKLGKDDLIEIIGNVWCNSGGISAFNIKAAFYMLNEDMTYKHLYISYKDDNCDTDSRYQWRKVTGIITRHIPTYKE